MDGDYPTRRTLRRAIRRFRANVHFLRQPFIAFLPLLGLLVAILLLGMVSFHHLYEKESLGYIHALYITYSLVFMEHLLEFPEHGLLQTFYFVVPLLGLMVILDGFVRFGFHVLRRREDAAEWVHAMAKTYRNHVILCGFGRVGLRVLQQLLRLGEDVVILEKNPENQNIGFARKHEIPLLIGSGREDGILENLNVREAKSIILATDDDLANLEMAIDARKVTPKIRVVMRMFDQELASKIHDSFDIHLAFSTAAVSAPLFATASSDRSIENAFYVGDKLLVVAHLCINHDSEFVGTCIRDIGANKALGADHHIYVLSHIRQQVETLFPDDNTELAVEDRLVVQTGAKTLRLLHGCNHDAKPY